MQARQTLITATILLANAATGEARADPLTLASEPLTLAAGVDPNVMILLDDSGSMDTVEECDRWEEDWRGRGECVEGRVTRMDIAKDVSTKLVEDNPDIRFGLTLFDGNEGGRIEAECGADQDTVLKAIKDTRANGGTPLAEAYYEVTRYFRGLSGFFQETGYQSPVEYRCQNSFVITVSDGEPTQDDQWPDNDPDDPDGLLPDWDEDNSDDDGYLDDFALFARDTDLRQGGTDATGTGFDEDPFSHQELRTFTIGFTTDLDLLEDAADYGGGEYYTADNAEELTRALEETMASIRDLTASAAPVAANTARIADDYQIYQARFHGGEWSGELRAFELDSTELTLSQDPVWEASNQIPAPDQRVIIAGDGTPLRWDALDDATQNALGEASVVDWLRGDPGTEERNGGDWRNRPHPLGDIVHSGPVHVGAPAAGYDRQTWSDGNETDYADYRETHTDRQPLIYVGANDGFLHAFDANSGEERFAYAPSPVLDALDELAKPHYDHRYYVDGTPTVADAWSEGNWRTFVTGGLGAGGQGIYLLDVTDPADLTSEDSAGDQVVWEFTDADDAELGYTFSRPAVARMADGNWAVIFGNGYNNSEADGHAGSGTASLFIAPIDAGRDGWSGDDYIRLDTGAGSADSPNGLATATPVDLDGDAVVDAVYAGDLRGNLWKFDVSSTGHSGWGIANDGDPLFQARSPDGERQPITSAPQVTRHPEGDGFMVYFGTGQYLEPGDADAVGQGRQSFYGILDEGDTVAADDLLEQEVTWEGTVDDTDVRVTSNQRLDHQHDGWYLDLPSAGERVVDSPQLRGGRVVFTTRIPSGDVCGYGGTGWLMELDAVSGARLNRTPFDVSGDGKVDGDDQVADPDGGDDKVAASGRRSESGMPTMPQILDTGEEGAGEVKFTAGTSGEVETIEEERPPGSVGRQSWRRLR
ncbi:MAG: PilC/PilY family type IV pilus protein [Pseudomonadota bacterium]